MSIIITETRNGSALPQNVFSCINEADFLLRVRAAAERSGMCEEIETTGQAIRWLDERYAQRTEIITEDEYRTTEGWTSPVVKLATRLGWAD